MKMHWGSEAVSLEHATYRHSIPASRHRPGDTEIKSKSRTLSTSYNYGSE